ncbi:hypothetical protein G6M89_08725 [Natronolimnobius sp. AArcel1]|uniref:hypothetical protein n=1 Tax=Natronolimnobius sp. AArcel1 TaxID=1679093 RepID=UPI0013EC9082|nr:hypothetical protein [Natronolimnobius sp. AArcel1]NGM69090.1 hypothetical protein [Natronolimnobius sp. AArcel1]
MNEEDTPIFDQCHIELLGPPGAGKSSIYNRVSSRNKMYGPNILRYSKLIPNNINILEYPLQKILKRYWDTSLKHKYFTKHLKNRPLTASLLHYVGESVKTDRDTILDYLIKLIASFEYGRSTKYKDEIVCIDEGFSQRCLGVLCRQPSNEFEISNFIDLIPSPGIVIHVDAPAELCLYRQVQRGNVRSDFGNPIKEINKMRDQCSEIESELVDQGVKTINVENIGEIETTVMNIEDQLHDMSLHP